MSAANVKDKIFICYRREDVAAYAALLNSRLTERLGPERVFIDVDSIGPGLDFVDSITQAIDASGVVLVLIGRRWSPERLHNPNDFVRIELLTALQQNARIIPLLFEEVQMPGAGELPAELTSLQRRNAVEIGTSRINLEIHRFVDDVEKILSDVCEPAGPPSLSKAASPMLPSPLPLPSQPPTSTSDATPRAFVSPTPMTPMPVGPQRRGRGWLASVFLAGTLVAVGVAVWYGTGHDKVTRPEGSSAPRPVPPGESKITSALKAQPKPEFHRIGIGFRARAFSENYLRATGMPDIGSSIEVTGVFQGGAAERAGVRKGDVIRKVDGRSIRDFDELSVISQYSVGENVNLEIWRGTRAMDLSVPVENGFELYKLSCETGVLDGCVGLGVFYESEGKDPARAASLYRQVCEAGNGEGCNNLGILYDNGRGVLKDSKEAAHLYEKACNTGAPMGCVNLAADFQYGEGVEKDPAHAVKLLQKACSLGEQRGCRELGRLWEYGIGVKIDLARARSLYEHACDAGDAASCTWLGVLFNNGLGVAKDTVQANTFYRVGCAGGDSSGCVNLGVAYHSGAGVRQDFEQAKKLFEQACKRKEGIGCFDLGLHYYNGWGVQKNLQRAVALYQQSCDLQSPDGCRELGVLCSLGRGVEKSAGRAKESWRKACDLGSMLACTDLGVQYESADNPDRDPARAASLYMQACGQGEPVGCRYLGSLHEKGEGMPKDVEKARELYRKACSLGDSEGCAKAKA